MKRWTRLLLMLGVLGLLAWYCWHARAEFALILSQIDGRAFARLAVPMLLVPIVSLAINAQISRDLVAEFDVRLRPLEAFALSAVNALGNYMPLPQAGAMARGLYLKKAHNLAYTTYAATIVVTYVSSLVLTGLFGLAGLAVLSFAGRPAPWPLWVAFAGLTASLLAFTPLDKYVRLPRRFSLFREGLDTLRQHHILLRIILLQCVLVLITATGLFLSARALPGGHEVSWPIALMLGLISMVAAVVNVLGAEQVAAMACAAILHIDPNLGLAASALFRLTAVVVVFTVGPFMAHWLAKRASPADDIAPPADRAAAATAAATPGDDATRPPASANSHATL
jgi:hypothetical protein